MLKLNPPPQIVFTGNVVPLSVETDSENNDIIFNNTHASIAIAVNELYYGDPSVWPTLDLRSGAVTHVFTFIHPSLSWVNLPNIIQTASEGMDMPTWLELQIMPVINNALIQQHGPGKYNLSLLFPGNAHFPATFVILIEATEPGQAFNLDITNISAPQEFADIWDFNAIPVLAPSGSGITNPQSPGLSPADYLLNPFARVNLRIDVFGEFTQLALPARVANSTDPIAVFDCSPAISMLVSKLPVPLPQRSAEIFSLSAYSAAVWLSYGNNISGSSPLTGYYYAIAGRVFPDVLAGFFDRMQNYFFTFQPWENIIAINQPVKLYYLNHDNPRQINVRYNIVYRNGSRITHDEILPTATPAFSFLCIDACPASLPNSDDIQYFNVKLVDESFATLCNARRYHVLSSVAVEPACLIFRNSLGVFDSITLPGRSIYFDKIEKDYPFESNKSQQAQQLSGIETNAFIYKRDHKQYLTELLMSPEIYIAESGEFIPLSPVTSDSGSISSAALSFETRLTFHYTKRNEYIHQ